MRPILAIALFSSVSGIASAGVMSHMTVTPITAESPKKYDAATVNRNDLKGCLVDAYSIDSADALFDAERPRMDAEREELKKLRDASAGVPTNASAAAGKELRERTKAFNARVAELNTRVAYAQEARDRFSRLCKGRRYYADDFHEARVALPVEVRDTIK